MRGHERAARCSARAIVLGASLAALSGCQQPMIGAPAQSGQTTGSPQVEITGATVSATNPHQLVVSLTAKSGGVPMSKEQLVALRPTFTLAALSPHPVDGLGSWRSLLLTGSQKAAQVPASGPGTPPAAIFANVKQPGSESTGALDGDAGEFTYLFANALDDTATTLATNPYVPTETHRVGVFLALAKGTTTTNATYDFVPAGGAPAPRDTVLDADCNRCHGSVSAHGGRRVGVKICLTCHTWQLTDPDTVDPAQLDGATASTDPNPLDLGRLVHRIHRGKNLPTLYQRSVLTYTGPSAWSPLSSSNVMPPAPFLTGSAANVPLVGRKYSIVGYQGQELVFGRIVSRTDNYQPARTVAEGVGYPQELRNCDACHAGAPQAYQVLYGISRRTCSGCHPDVWFQSAAVTDSVHFPHIGGPQADDTQCSGCHVAPIPGVQDKVWVRVSDVHVATRNSPYWDKPSIEIVSVSNLKPGSAPTIVFKLKDRVGTILTPSAPVPVNETGGAAPSPIPRTFPGGTAPGLRIVLTGPTTPDYDTPQLMSSDLSSGALVNPDVCAQTADASGAITYTFNATLPASATGSWAVLFEGRRSKAVPFYDVASQTFRWPYTGETVYESFDNAIAYVDTATGSWAAAAPGAAVPRRTVVTEEKCLACHGRFELHGFQRHQVEACLICHSPQRTDWARRPKLANGNVNLAATYDGIEERSVHLKVMVHRIHTGGATGAASLEAIEPHIIYAYGNVPTFFDEAIFPTDLGNCTRCHVGTSYRVESVPADAPSTVANEGPMIRHAGTAAHVAGEPSTPPIQAACLGCHANGFTQVHATSHTVNGVEQCAQCHVRGSTSVDIAHGLAQPNATIVSASFGSIVQNILVPRCASAACHGGNPPANFPRLDADGAYDAIVGVASQQASGVKLVDPYAPDASYMLIKMRGDAASVGGIATPMPIGDAALDASDLAAFEAWILNGAPND